MHGKFVGDKAFRRAQRVLDAFWGYSSGKCARFEPCQYWQTPKNRPAAATHRPRKTIKNCYVAGGLEICIAGSFFQSSSEIDDRSPCSLSAVTYQGKGMIFVRVAESNATSAIPRLTSMRRKTVFPCFRSSPTVTADFGFIFIILAPPPLTLRALIAQGDGLCHL